MSFILVGHYFPTTSLIEYGKVIGVISGTYFDHRELPATVKIIKNDKALSNASIIVNEIQRAKELDTSRYLLTILFYAILLSTKNLWSGGRFTKLDHDIYQLVATKLLFSKDYILKQFGYLLDAYHAFQNLTVFRDRVLYKNMDIISTKDGKFRTVLVFVPVAIDVRYLILN